MCPEYYFYVSVIYLTHICHFLGGFYILIFKCRYHWEHVNSIRKIKEIIMDNAALKNYKRRISRISKILNLFHEKVKDIVAWLFWFWFRFPFSINSSFFHEKCYRVITDNSKTTNEKFLIIFISVFTEQSFNWRVTGNFSGRTRRFVQYEGI